MTRLARNAGLPLRSSYQESYYQGTIITWEKAVKDAKTQLIDALIESYVGLNS